MRARGRIVITLLPKGVSICQNWRYRKEDTMQHSRIRGGSTGRWPLACAEGYQDTERVCGYDGMHRQLPRDQVTESGG